MPVHVPLLLRAKPHGQDACARPTPTFSTRKLVQSLLTEPSGHLPTHRRSLPERAGTCVMGGAHRDCRRPSSSPSRFLFSPQIVFAKSQTIAGDWLGQSECRSGAVWANMSTVKQPACAQKARCPHRKHSEDTAPVAGRHIDNYIQVTYLSLLFPASLLFSIGEPNEKLSFNLWGIRLWGHRVFDIKVSTCSSFNVIYKQLSLSIRES